MNTFLFIKHYYLDVLVCSFFDTFPPIISIDCDFAFIVIHPIE